MFSFDGQYGSKRRPLYVQVGPKNLIQKAQEERKQRARRNLEQKAATLIQSFIRGAMSRRKTNDYLRQTFNQLAEQLLALEEDRSCDPLCINSLCTCLRAFRIFSEKGVSDDDAAVVAKVLLSPTCQTAYSQWINTNEKSILNTITQIIIRLLCYLRNLPPAAPSRLYVLPVRVLEALLRSEASRSSEQASACLLQISLNLCKFGLYYFSLAVFIDRQSLEADCDNLLEDFLRQPKNQALADLLKLPFEHCLPKDLSEGKLSTMTQEFLSSALNDVTAAARLEASGNQSTASKIPRLVFPILLNAIPRELLIGQLYASAVGDATDDVQGPAARRLQPSLTLLHRFICGIVPGLLSASPSFQPTPSQTDASEQAVDEEQAELLMQQQQLWATPQASSAADADATDSSLVLAVLRILAWMFTSMMSARCPADGGAATTAAVTAKFSPPFPLLSLRSSGNTADDTDSDDDGGGGGGNVGEAVDQSPGTADAFVDEASLRFTNVWPTQTAEVFASLQKYLPSLAGIALRELYNSQVSRHPQRQEIVLCLCTLHSMLSFVKSASASSMIPLNSVLSQFPEFLRDLWDLTQNLLSSKTDDQWHSDIKFFDLIASGEIKRMPRNIDQYTAIVLTFVDCLRHRLLCLTDVEINASEEMPSRTPSSPCGFAPAELLLMGARLRDLMIGLIHLTYPSRRPERRGAHDNDDDNDTVLKIREIISRVGEQRLHGRRALALAYTAFSTDEVLRLRWLLRRWTTLFTHTQALVTLIYDWDHRRQSREAVNLTRRSQNDPGRSIWLKPGAVPAFSLDSLPVWLRGGDGMVALAGLPFGYYGCLNVDQNDDRPLTVSYSDWRQMTTLMEMPFVISFWQRVQIFQSLVMENRQSIQGPSRATLNYVPEREIHSLAPIQIRARRGYIYEDAFEKLSKENEPSLHPRLNVTFLNEADVVEMGVDGGGLSREFLNQAIAEGFNPARGFFLYTDDNTLYPNPNAAAVTPDYLKHFFFLGRLLAKAIYEGMLVELRFAHFFLAKLVSRTEGFSVGFDYLRSLDKELYRQLCMLKTYEGNVRDLELDFTTVQSAFGESRVIELKPGGSSIPVTNATRVEYVHLVANYKLNRQIYRQSKAFIAGMADVLFLDWLRLFDAEELQVLISGADMDIDVDDLKAHTHYVGDMTLPANKMTVEIFWRVVHGFTQEQKRSLLRFATACSRPPMFGFQDLQPPFSIQVVPDTERLPTSSTCMNLLKIPAYQDSRLLRSKLLYALNANAGFEYS